MNEKLKELTPAIEQKAEELSKKFKRKVTPFAFIVGDEVVVGYLKDADRLDKMRAIDLYDQSRTQAGDIILRTSLIQEESDSRILDEKLENDPIYLGAIDFAVKSVTMYTEVLKKK